jgi:hypothetical protein
VGRRRSGKQWRRVLYAGLLQSCGRSSSRECLKDLRDTALCIANAKSDRAAVTNANGDTDSVDTSESNANANTVTDGFADA